MNGRLIPPSGAAADVSGNVTGVGWRPRCLPPVLASTVCIPTLNAILSFKLDLDDVDSDTLVGIVEARGWPDPAPGTWEPDLKWI